METRIELLHIISDALYVTDDGPFVSGTREAGVEIKRLPVPSGMHRAILDITYPHDSPVVRWHAVTGSYAYQSDDEAERTGTLYALRSGVVLSRHTWDSKKPSEKMLAVYCLETQRVINIHSRELI